jgi:competence protein ComEC
VSHLLAISGFHLGVLSAVVFFLLRFAYRPLHARFFPYRHGNRDLFILTTVFLFAYVWFLGFIPSLIRAFMMLVVGYFLYDRGIKVISMQTLFVSVGLLIAFFPQLLLSLGFFLSVAGVYYIFLFLQYFKDLGKWKLFFWLPVFVYATMLPFSLYFFGSFSFWHPLSILWTELFTLFYPLSILLHLLHVGWSFDTPFTSVLDAVHVQKSLHVNAVFFYMHVALSLLALRSRLAWWLLFFEAALFFIYAVYYVA